VLLTSPFAALRACAEAGMSLGGLTVGAAVALARVYAATRLQTAWRGHSAVSCTVHSIHSCIWKLITSSIRMCSAENLMLTIGTVHFPAASAMNSSIQLALTNSRTCLAASW
jgi:hypothetical protein